MRRSLYLTITLLCVSAQVYTQLPLNHIADAGTDLFDIGTARSFSASKGNQTVPEWRPESDRKERQIISDLGEAIDIIRSKHVSGRNIDLNSLTKSVIGGALQSLDPHSSYFDAAEYGEFLNEEQSEYSGIGATIAGFRRDGQYDTYVTSTVPGSPASSAHLAYGDRILSVNGESASGRDTTDIRDAVRGTAGTVLTLTVERAVSGRTEKLLIRRRMVQQPSIRDAFLLPGDIGYVAMTEGFNYTTANELSSALHELHRQGAKGLILDIRENPGGILEQAVRIAEKFLPAGSVILTQRGRSKLDNRVWTSMNHSPETLPLVLLVNENSASASEILAGALQDHDRALIVGERTFGKGLVQSLFDGPNGTGLTLTTARYFTPSGRSIQRDYSNGQLYDYYNHRIEESLLKRTEAHTSANRAVFGGDGIEPDITIGSHQFSKIERDLDDVVFFFARDLVNGRLSSGYSLKTNFVLTSSSEATDEQVKAQLFNEFEKYAHLGSNAISTDIDLASRQQFINERINFYLTLAKKGDVLANRIETADDLPVIKAISELPKARELAIAGLDRH